MLITVSWIVCVARGNNLCLTENLRGVAGGLLFRVFFGNNLNFFQLMWLYLSLDSGQNIWPEE